MYYGAIKKCDIANGIGVRVSLFVSGCTHHCKECFNPQTWDFRYGQPFTVDTEEEILEALAPAYITGLSVLGGEPMEPENQRGLIGLYRKMQSRLPAKDIWVYTGYTLEQDLAEGGRAYTELTDEILAGIDTLVDGEFVLEKKDITLKFRGSSNQRLIDMKATRLAGKTILVNPDEI